MKKLYVLTTNSDNVPATEVLQKGHGYIIQTYGRPKRIPMIRQSGLNQAQVLRNFEKQVLKSIEITPDDRVPAILLFDITQFTKLRVMAKQGKIEPFTVIVVSEENIEELHIDKDGHMVETWPEGVFDIIDDMLSELL